MGAQLATNKDIVGRIFSYLPIPSIINCMMTSSYSVGSELDDVWYSIFMNKYPEIGLIVSSHVKPPSSSSSSLSPASSDNNNDNNNNSSINNNNINVNNNFVFGGKFKSWQHCIIACNMCSFRFDPELSKGGKLYRDNTLFLATNDTTRWDYDEETKLPRKRPPVVDADGNPIDTINDVEYNTPSKGTLPSGWRKTITKSPFPTTGRYYWEVRCLWVNPSYGDIIVGLSEVIAAGNSVYSEDGTLSTPDNHPSVGLYCNAGSRSTCYFRHRSSWDFGGSGPRADIKTDFSFHENATISVLYDATEGTMEILVDRKFQPGRPLVRIEKGKSMSPFVVLYSDTACAQLLTHSTYPDVAANFLFGVPLKIPLEEHKKPPEPARARMPWESI